MIFQSICQVLVEIFLSFSSLLLAFKSPLEAELIIKGKLDKQDSQAHTETGKNV